jgi:L-galactose dehydrogenase
MRIFHTIFSFQIRLISSELDEENAIQAIQQAIRSGINYIDTAYWYGQGKSEEILGRALATVPRRAYYLATKVARYERDYPNMFDFSAEAAKKSFARSLNLLNLDYVDILQIHDLEFAPNKEMIWNELLPALEELKATGKVKFIGVTGYPLHELKQCVVGAVGRFDMVLSYCRNTLCDDSLVEYLPFFKNQRLGLICASPVAMQLLSNAGPQAWHPASKELKALCQQAAMICKAKNIELAKLALYHALKTVGPNGPDSILVGMQTVEIVKMNLSVAVDGLSVEELKLYDHLNAE